MSQEYVLIQDCDCHWYVCPADKQTESNAYFDAVDAYWSANPDDDSEEPKMPAYLVRVGGSPSLVKFTSYRIG